MQEQGIAIKAFGVSVVVLRYHSAMDAVEVAPAFVAFVSAGAQVVINDEHSEFKWVLISEVDDYLSTPNQCELFAYVQKYFVERDPAKWVVDLIPNL